MHSGDGACVTLHDPYISDVVLRFYMCGVCTVSMAFVWRCMCARGMHLSVMWREKGCAVWVSCVRVGLCLFLLLNTLPTLPLQAQFSIGDHMFFTIVVKKRKLQTREGCSFVGVLEFHRR